MKKLVIILSIFFCEHHQGFSQLYKSSTTNPKNVYIIKGDYYFEHANYTQAIINYTESIRQKPTDSYTMLKLAESYHRLNTNDLAVNWYNKAFSSAADIDERYTLEYVTKLVDKNKYDELKQISEQIINETPTPDKLSIYSSNGDVITLFDQSTQNLEFEFIPNQNYTLIIDYDNFKAELIRSKKDKTELLKRNIYTFHIQKIIETVFKQSANSERFQNLHINPGDLITFQLLPSSSNSNEPTFSRIRFKKKEATINDTDTIVFSYVAKLDPKTQVDENPAPITDLTTDEKITSIKDETIKTNLIVNSIDTINNKDVAIIKPTDTIQIQSEVDELDALKLIEPTEIANNPINSIIAADTITYHEKITSREVDSVETNLDVNSEDTINNKDVAILYPTDTTQIHPEIAELNAPQIIEPTKITHNPINPIIAADTLAHIEKVVLEEIPNSKEQKDIINNNMQSGIINSSSPFTNYLLEDEEKTEFRYRVQIAAARSEINEKQLSSIYNGSKKIEVFNEEGYYKYYIEETPNYPKAKLVLNESNVKNAFIVAYKGNEKWKLYEAISAQKKELIEQNSNNVTQKDVLSQVIKNEKEIQNISGDNNSAQETKLTSKTITDSFTNKEPVIVKDAFNPSKQVDVSQQKESIKLNQPDNTEVISIPIISDTNTTLNQTIPWNESEKYLAQEIAQPQKQEMLTSFSTSQDNTKEEPMSTEFLYRVQIAAARSEMSDSQLKLIYSGPKEIHAFKEDGYYKYAIEETSSYYRAKQILNEESVKNAFIVAYKGNKKWNLPEAIAVQYKVPTIKSELSKSDSIVKVVTVNFEFDKFTLASNEKQHLKQLVVDILKANEEYYAIVNGYTDTKGSAEYNFGLSQERALTVKQFISTESIKPNRVSTQYFGESQLIKHCPKGENCDESVHQANRRVEVLIMTPKIL